MKKITITMILVAVLAATGCSSKTELNEQRNKQEVIQSDKQSEVIVENQVQDEVTVITKEETLDSEFIKIQIKLPQISGMKDEEVQEKLNNEFMTIYDLKDSMQKEAEEFALDLKKNNIPSIPYELITDYNVSYNQNGLLSLTMTVYTYTGGAHGGTSKTTYNVDVNLGKQISLKSLFKDEVDYKDLMNQEISKQIAREPDMYFTGEQGFTTVADNQNFYIEEGKIVIYFSQYEIAPYAAGIPEFEIQLSQLAESLKPEYVERTNIK